MRRLVVAPLAKAEIQEAVHTSAERRGHKAARRYRNLINFAIRELRQDPDRPAAKRIGATGIHLYPLRHSARRLDPIDAVRAAPHVLAYRFDAATVEIVRLLHEAMDLPRRLEIELDPQSLDSLPDEPDA